MREPIMKLPIRYYQIEQVYGPGMPPSGREGHHERTVEKPAGKVGLVLVHCWNLGEADGPYPIDADTRIPGKAGNWVPVAHEIIREHIEPVRAAARQAGVAVFHLAQDTYAPRYAAYRRIQSEPTFKAPPQPRFRRCTEGRSYEQQHNDEYGPDFPGCVWQTHKDKFDIAEPLRPINGEHVVVNGWQLNELCRQKGIDTLFYAGFMADICLINSSGAMREMSNKYRYTCVVLRECTAAYEYEDTYEGKWMTLSAIRRIETELGYSASARDFIAAARALTKD